MKIIISVLIFLFGIALGLYLGLYVLFVGGIVQIIEAFRQPEILPLDVAFGIVKMLFASVVGWISFMICTAFALAIIKD